MKRCSHIVSFVLCITNVLVWSKDLELGLISPQNLDSSLPVSHVCVFCPSQSFLFIGQSVMGLFWKVLPHSASWTHHFTVLVDTGVWWVLFSAAPVEDLWGVSVLNETFSDIFLLARLYIRRSHSSSCLVRASLCFSLKEVGRDFMFPCNLYPLIAVYYMHFSNSL